MTSVINNNTWSGKTDGLPWMQRSLIAIFHVMPLWMLYSAMAFIVPFYMLINKKGFDAIFQFFHERFHYGRLKSFRYVYYNHFRFGQVILDRFGMYAGKKYKIITDGQEMMDELEMHNEGFVLFGSHVGNYEIAGYSLKPKSKRFNAIMHAGETATVMDNRLKLLSNNNMGAIMVKEDLSHLFNLNSALDNGEIVSIYADRRLDSQKCIECEFLNEKAPFPMGPFAIAAQKEVSALAVFVMKNGYKSYHAYVRKIQYDRQANIRLQINQIAQGFTNNLEDIVRKYPTQWFNYFDFWRQ